MFRSVVTVLCLLCTVLTASVRADERFFTYIYETDLLPKGKVEFEQWLTYRGAYPDGNRNFDRHIWDFREEVEYGITDRLSLAGYLNFRYDSLSARRSGLGSTSEFSFEGISAEFKYQLLNPNTQPVGAALYFEPTYNGDEQELEYKLLFSKMLHDRWVLAANIGYEQEWEEEDGDTERESVFEVVAGAAYRITPHWSVGFESRYHAVYEGIGLEEHLGTGWFVGPTVHYGSARWWGTLTVLPQITGNPSNGGIDRTEHQAVETRLIIGVNF